MNWLKRFARFTLGAVRKLTASEWLVDWLGGGEISSGVTVTEEKAQSVTAVYACVRVLSQDVSSLPLFLYRRDANDSRRKTLATGHPLFSLLHNSPNPEMTSLTWREVSMRHLNLRGNAYSEIERDRADRVKGLWPLTPDRVSPYRDEKTKEIRYEIRLPSGGIRDWSADRVLHIKNDSNNGLLGLSPIDLHREAIGLSVAAQEYGARFFANDARPGGVLEHPNTLGDDAHKRLRKSWEATHQPLSNKHRLAILEEGMKWKEVGVRPEEAQFLETRKFQVPEIARIFRVPPHKIADLERATFSNVEQQSIEYVTGSLRPWLVKWEQEIWLKLLSEEERQSYFAEHVIEGLLRGDIKSRYDAYAIGRQWGWLSANDIRAIENLNPLPEEIGDTYLSPLNMVPAQLAETVALKEGNSNAKGNGNAVRSAASLSAPPDRDLGRRLGRSG